VKREAGKLAGKLARKRRREMEREREREERPRGQIQPLTAGAGGASCRSDCFQK
jgi:hypothetical protein